MIATQTRKQIPPTQIKAAVFEYSTDGRSWVTVWVQSSPLADAAGIPSGDHWEAFWRISDLASGLYSLRVRMETITGQQEAHTIAVLLNDPPVPMAKAAAGTERGKVKYDGTQSRDSDGRVMEWIWDFGDGNTATGDTAEHRYTDLTRTYQGSLTVRDNLGTTASFHFRLSFNPTTFEPVLALDPSCTCKNITVRTRAGMPAGSKALDPADDALGPEGDGSKTWGKSAGMNDGKRLGPLKGGGGTPGNDENTDDWIGYGFEIVCEVVGNPAACDEIQLVRMTAAKADGSSQWERPWKGLTKDLDLDGTFDIDFRPGGGQTSQQKCEAAGGTWDGTMCNLKFPQSGGKYGPDEGQEGEAGGAYENRFRFKQYPDKKIITYDTPGSPKAYNSGDADFIFIVRDTNVLGEKVDSYCFVAFRVRANRAGLPETLEVTSHKDKDDNNDGAIDNPGAKKADLPDDGWP
jgi:hypothetical protein